MKEFAGFILGLVLSLFVSALVFAQMPGAAPDADTLQARANVLQAERDQLEQNLSALLVQLNKTAKSLQDCQAKAAPADPKAASTAPLPSPEDPATK